MTKSAHRVRHGQLYRRQRHCPAGGAVVYTGSTGKGWARDMPWSSCSCTLKRLPQVYDGFFVLDADNVLDCRFVEEMNRTFSDGYEVVTSYRNSKTMGTTGFPPAMPCGLSGNPVPEQLPDASGHQLRGVRHGLSVQPGDGRHQCKFHLLTEDIEFSVHTSSRAGRSASGRCGAYDEQPLPSASPGGSGCAGPGLSPGVPQVWLWPGEGH